MNVTVVLHSVELLKVGVVAWLQQRGINYMRRWDSGMMEYWAKYKSS